ncbi:tetrahydrofolate dehydrogenase/cyclohydrolase catalytic domain-containing protein [Umezawaea sp.]|uniref:tetrahydrofolate dehydrogenase/cyclohydrolase catalytic domain-containing protein n=1 Tax=Umezawaea sp. TaxID=1955258 RepID=UPI002ED02B76
MPVPVKARAPATSATPSPEADVARARVPSGGTAMARGSSDVVAARAWVGNAAVTSVLGASAPGVLPRGTGPDPSGWTGRMMLAGQDLVGNQVVARQATAPSPVIPRRPAPSVQRRAKVPSAPAPDPKDLRREEKAEGAEKETRGRTGTRSPSADPKFRALKRDVRATTKRIGSSHPPAAAEAGAAQAASVPPADDREARGKAAHAEDMDAAKPREFDKAAFVRAVEDAIAKRAPKNLDEADEFGGSGKADEVKAEVQGEVEAGKEGSAKEIADTTAAVPEPAPDAKQVVPLTPDQRPGKPAPPNPTQAVPDASPPSATDMSAGPARVQGQMAAANVTEQQLAFTNSREPAFDGAVRDKKAMDAHAATAPGELRKGEAREFDEVKRTAAASGATAVGAIHATRARTGDRVMTGKVDRKGQDQDKRAQVTALLQTVFDRTKTDVEKILSDLDGTVDQQFSREEKRARDRFTEEHTEGMREYKSRRYSGLDGKARWVKDLFADLPEEANQIYVRAKDNYLTAMRGVISGIADTVERELRRAKDRIASGREELKAAVDKLPQDLRAIGREAAAEFNGRFDELRDSVDDKGTELVDTLATKYTDAVKAVDAEIAAEKEKNKSLWSKAADKIGGVINTIKELGRLLLGVLRKAATAVGLILRDPIGFLGNLITGVGGGLKLFMKNAGRHLQQGVLAWLLGTGVGAGLQLPTTFDVLGILVMIAGLLGLSWPNLRARLARKVDPRALAAAETGADAVPIVVEARKRGVAGLWSDLKSRVGDLKKELIGKLVSYLLPTIIIAGVTWIVSLLNPASAFIRACKMIIDIIRFIVTQGRQIIEFVNAVLDSVIAIARGATGGVAALVERALARSIPVLIGALAAILGIGGIAGKVRSIFQQLARPVNRAIDWVIDKITGLLRKLWAKLKARMDRRKKPKEPKEPRKDRDRRTARPRQRRRPRRGRKPGADRRRRPDRERDQTPTKKKRRLDAALEEAEKLFDDRLPPADIKAALPSIRARHEITSLVLVSRDRDGVSSLRVKGRVNPSDSTPEHPYGFEVKIHIYENEVSGVEILRQVRAEYAGRFREQIVPLRKKVAVIRMKPAPSAEWQWRARMEASAVSARQKERITTALGFIPEHVELDHNIPVAEFAAVIRGYNSDPSVTAIIVQLPVRQRYRAAVNLIDPRKDIDSILGPARSEFPVGATSEGVVRVAEPFLGDKPVVAVVGAKGFVGRGVVSQLGKFDVRIIELDVGDSLARVRDAAVVISVTGQEGILTPELVLPSHRLVVDSGFVPKRTGPPASDVDPRARPIPRQVTPVPGGIGPVEMAILAERLVRKELGSRAEVPTWRLTDPEGRIRR